MCYNLFGGGKLFFGKIKNTENTWGFDVFETTFESFISIDNEEHMKIIDKANTSGKIISGDKDGKPILIDPPEPSKKEAAEQKILELKSYLESTDWYVIRLAEEGTTIPDEIRKSRHSARTEISELRKISNS